MLRVGLTGGIASGKSTICKHFEELGISIIDTDSISHELMQPGQEAYQQVVEHFGKGILDKDKRIDRTRLRELVFNNADEKNWLEQMIHPLIRQRSQQALQSTETSHYAILVVPLMFETGFDNLVDHVIAIDCPPETQLTRLVRRDGISRKLAQQMISAQMSNDQRLHLADSHIKNDDDKDRLPDVKLLHKRLLNLARHRRVK